MKRNIKYKNKLHYLKLNITQIFFTKFIFYKIFILNMIIIKIILKFFFKYYKLIKLNILYKQLIT